MLSYFWFDILVKPILNSLLFINHFVGSVGLAIIILTLLVKIILLPLNIPNIKMQSKKKELDAELKKINKKYKDKQEAAKAQMELYKKHGVNPASGCLPMIVQIFIFVALYRVFINVFANGIDENLLYHSVLIDTNLNLNFLYLNLAKPDPFYILPILTGVSQFFMSKMMMPSVKKGEEIAEKTPQKSDDMMYNIQQQMLYIAPIMTGFIGITLPSGLVLYWFVSTLFSTIQNKLLKKFI